jgi:hypothetical protein
MKPESGEKIDSWDGILEFYRKSEQGQWRKRWVFRGHKDASWCLETTLERAVRKQLGTSLKEEAERWEHKLTRQFQRIAPMHLAQPPGEQSWIEWLALLRHYGGPSRLLDWTYSFLIALFQAVETANDTQDCAVWALDVDWWKRKVMEQIPELKDVRNKNDPHSREEFDVIRKMKGKLGIWPVNAFRLNERLHAQQGVFVLPLDVSSSFMENLKGSLRDSGKPQDGRDHIWKIIIPSKIRKECLIELQRMNIQNQSLFRGLDGLARDLENQMLMPHLFEDIEPNT